MTKGTSIESVQDLLQQQLAIKQAKLLARASKKITPEQGLYIKYKLKCTGLSSAAIAIELGCTAVSVCNVLSGKSHSQRIERAVATKLGYDSWNDMVQKIRDGAA